MLTIVTCLWGDKYTGEHVNRLKNQLDRHLHMPFEFIAIVESRQGIRKNIRCMKIWPEISKQLHPKRPNCYRRLRLFSSDMVRIFGPGYLLNLDLDILITDDITHLIKPLVADDSDVTFKAYRDRATNTPYNGGMWLLKTGAHPEVWGTFDPLRSPRITADEGRVGSDQAWIGHALGPDFPTWDVQDGVYAFGRDILRGRGGELPEDARIIMMYGPYDPAKKQVKWVKEHWR